VAVTARHSPSFRPAQSRSSSSAGASPLDQDDTLGTSCACVTHGRPTGRAVRSPPGEYVRSLDTHRCSLGHRWYAYAGRIRTAGAFPIPHQSPCPATVRETNNKSSSRHPDRSVSNARAGCVACVYFSSHQHSAPVTPGGRLTSERFGESSRATRGLGSLEAPTFSPLANLPQAVLLLHSTTHTRVTLVPPNPSRRCLLPLSPIRHHRRYGRSPPEVSMLGCSPDGTRWLPARSSALLDLPPA